MRKLIMLALVACVAAFPALNASPAAANANSTHAVSQYDIACFQVSQSH